MKLCLCERLTFDKLFRISDPKRVYRSFTVKGPPLELDSYQDAVYYAFNFKANPSTTGLRHRGYIKFFKPLHKNPNSVPLQHLECLVDCTCPDFRYRWAWANKQRQSSLVGPQSLNQAWNKAPRKTNPTGKPGLCKHILAARQFIYGLMSAFPSDQPDTAQKLDKLTKFATKRWTDFDAQMRAAKEREAEILRRRQMRNIGQRPVTPPPAPAPATPPPIAKRPVSPDAPKSMPKNLQPKSTQSLKDLKSEPLPEVPLALPPGQRGRAPAFGKTPTALSVPPGQRGRKPAYTPPIQKSAVKPNPPAAKPKEVKSKRVIGNRIIQPPTPGAYGWIRPEESYLCGSLNNLILESVVSSNSDNMKTITEAIKLVTEMEAEELSQASSEAPFLDSGDDDITGGSTLEPSEPPVSDSAIGADTEGETALSLLRSMKTSLEQIAAAVAPPMDAGPEGAEGAIGAGAEGLEGANGLEGAEGEASDLPMPDEPPVDGEELGEEAETETEEAEEGEKPEDDEDKD